MNLRNIKTKLIGMIGETPIAVIQALRFIYLIYTNAKDPETSLLPKLLSRGDTTVDVGANGANWTYSLHQAVGKSGCVYAFEADPYYALATDLTIKFLLMSRGVRMFPYGLSDVDEQVRLRIKDSDGLRLSGQSYVDKRSISDDSAATLVTLKRLDSLIADQPRLLSTKLIKCDVEGYELFVFRGAAQILEHSKPIVILETGNYESQGYSAHDLFDFFAVRDYVCFAMIAENTLARTDHDMNHEKALSVNRVLLPTSMVPIVSRTIDVLQ
jgi:FkbM family methyltransferase